VVLRVDGGGKVLAYLNPIVGLDRILRLYAGLKGKIQPGVLIRRVWIDGLPGYVTREQGDILQTTAFAVENGRITAIYITRNLDKLSHVANELATDWGQ
jgi:hypothetical protein